jgi:hypothetical protein
MFDPYHNWIGLPPGPRPPTHYQLLGIVPTETDPEVIKEAALRQTAQVRVYQTGPHSELCTRVLNEIAQARAVLLNPKLRREYDQRLAALPSPIEMPALVEEEELPAPVPVPVRRPANVNPTGLIAALAYLLLLMVGAAASFWLTYDGLVSAALRDHAP